MRGGREGKEEGRSLKRGGGYNKARKEGGRWGKMERLANVLVVVSP